MQIQFASQMWATRPHLANIFEKLLDQKTFQFACGSGLETILLKKTVFPVRQMGVPPLLLPTSMLQLPRCLVRTYNLDFHDLTLFEWDSFKRCNCSRKSNSQKSNLLCKCGLLAHTSAAFLKNCCTEKLFSSPAARFFYHNSNKKTGISLI